SDQSNDLSHLFHDPLAPPLITYDPIALLEQIDAGAPEPLACRERLASVVMHLGRLKSMVTDFPAPALMSAQGKAVALSGVDWNAVDGLLAGAAKAVEDQDPARAAELLQRALAIAPEYVAAA